MSRARAQSFVSDSAAAAENEPTENLQRCLVYCRMRPTKPGELNEKDGTFKLVELNKKRIIVGQNGEKEYAYDGTFGGDSTQEDIFQEVAKPSLMHVLKGYTAAIMCYGQTGTGKSFTMSNTRLGQEGIIPRSAGFLFDLIEQTKTKEYTLTAHFVQIYRDHLSDLMKENQAEAKVDIRFDTKKGVEIMNCTNIPVPSKAAFLEMYKEGDARRIVRPTKMNPESSRGHTALVLYVKSRSTDPDDMSMPTEGKITFIDLAGYERFDKTGVKDPIHKDEAKKINASLLSLGHVVTALSQGEKFVPWRNSKLTRLLQDSIGGRSRSTIVITIGPSSASLHETTNSLEFGNRAMDVAVSSNKEENVDFQKLAAKLQLLLDESEEHVNKLVLAEKTREAERLDRERRHKHDIDRLRGRHRDELTRLMEEGATRERIEELLRLQEVEDLNLQEQQIEERDMDDSRFEEEERTMVQGIEQEHMVRAASMRKEATAAKQRELDTACEMIAKLRNTEPTPEALLAIAAEISEQAGSPSPSDPEEAASPRTVNSAELAILVRQIEELKREAEEKEEKTRETTEKMKAAHLKCANLLKEQREKNKAMVEETVAREDLERLQGQLDEMTTARDSAASHRDELEDKMQTMQKQVNHSASECEKMALESKKAQSMIAQLTAFKEELEEKLQVARQEREEVVEEYNRKEREKEASREETAADSTRKITELNGEIGELKATIGTVEATLAEVKAEKKSLDEQLAALTANLEEQKKLLAERDEKEKQLNAAIESEKERSEGASATGKKRERELETAVEQCRDETRAIEKQLKSEIEDTETRCAQRVASLAEEIRDLEQKLEQGTTASAAQRDAAAAAEASLSREAESLAAASEEKALEITRLAAALAQQEGLVAEAQQRAEAAEKSLADLQEAHSEGAASRDTLEQGNQELRDALQAREGALEQEGVARKEAEEQVQALSSEKEALTSEKDRLEKELAEVMEAKAGLEKELEEASAAREALQQSSTESQERSTQQAAESATALQALDTRKGELEAEVASLGEKLAETEAALAAAQEKVSALEAAAGDSSEAAGVLTAERDGLQKELEEAKAELAARDERLSDASQQLAAATEKLGGLTSEKEELDVLLETAQDELTSERKTLDAKNDELQDLADKLKLSEDEAADAAAELNEEKKRFEDLEDAKDALQRELEDAKADSEEERERITSEHAEELAKERERIEQLEDEAECSTELQNVLEERVKELEEELQRLQGDLKDLKTTSELETEETRRRSNLEREQERLRQEMEQAVMREQIKNARKNAVGGKYKYSSKLVSQLIGAGQMPIPRSAPPLLKREEILETLDLEEVRSALRYNIVCVGAQHTGKSSIQKLLSHTSGGGLMKKAPDVVTPSPGFSRAEYISKDKGSSKGFSLGKKNTVNTYFNVWDTPCDPRMLQGLPAGALPAAGCCYTVSFFLNHEFVSEAKKMEEVLLGVFSCIGAKAKGKRVPVMLVGTRKDLLHNSKDGMLAIKKIAEAKKWFRENAILKERFKLIDCFAVSVKDWSVQNDSGKTGVSSFGQIMSMLANELQAVYPITPPALLGRDTTPAHQADIADWHHSLDGRDVSGDKAREEKAIYESVLSIIVLLHRMRQRKTWLVGQADFNSVVTDNIPSFALEPNPAVVDHIQDFLSCRGDAFSRRDLEYKDPREGVVVLDPLMLCNFVDTLMLPSLYLSLVDVYADKPGHLKQVIQKSTGFNVEEFWRPDWELIFDGKVSGTATSCLLKGFTPFKKDPVLGRRFLGLLGVCFQHDKLKTDQVDFMPSMAICTMSPEIQSLFLSLFKKTKGDWSPCSARIEQGVSAHVASEVLRQVYQMDPNAILWRDGAAFSDNGAWAYVKLEPARISICCEGKGSPLQKVLQKAVEASLDSSAALTWKDGLHMDELPRLPPALSKEVDDAESIGALLAKLPRDRLRGVSYPAGTIDLDMRRRH
eukprot:TRINITY_DN5019_c0_g1_i5.p1 TRINITY_DN5019_c0_g1~~TRINITY_DN5019_c0_g1_i5.p1  ORF type:complete len:1969 (+),score=977.10 TRINITY_DN5019_c0_g1_i5:117-6023(+)